MRTTLDLDDDLVAALMAKHPGKSKTAAIEAEISSSLQRDAAEGLRAMAGTFADVEWDREADREAELRRAERMERRWRGDAG